MSEPTSADFASLLESRYREAPSFDLPALNQTIECLLKHRSVRDFLPDALPEATLETLVAAAQSAPTSSNLQAWSVIAVTDPAVKARLAMLAGNQKHIEAAPLFLVFLADLSRVAAFGERREMNMEGLDFLESLLLGVIDAALAAQNALVAAESLGLGTVCIGGMRNKALEVTTTLGLPSRCFAIFGLCVGRPNPNRPAAVKPRLPQKAVLHRDRYDAGGQDEAIGGYETRLAAFRREQALDAISWTTQITNRLKDAKSLHGRDVLRESLRQMGFPLI
ncbi:NADPH-dependent oxidoreductase [Mesorhizobium sp. BE184]|uniref:NADPH-dependent oxidoreductase n=1 Tax=Mesorhizobium sp. BE184 TaxID=2817714 RepID=UPI002859E4EC|nr:NADPH-dependent oxidoreductase [Mesorhizobium sp. BE184]MDR7033144.1 nitroreductase [Mesorhizobium sp. BE184]